MPKRVDLSHIRFLGGATDSGKTTVAQILAARHGWRLYHYDRTDLAHHQRLVQTDTDIRQRMNASLDDNWVKPTPQELMQRTLRSFELRFPLVIEDLLALPKDTRILAEGFGLTPALLQPLIADSAQAIWLFPTETFKRESMTRRGKPSFGNKVSDPQWAKQNLFERDMMLAAYLQTQAREFDFQIMIIDGSQTPDDVANIIEPHFGLTTHH